MALSEALIGVAGVAIGAGLNHLLAVCRDRSIPDMDLVRVTELSEVPECAKDVLTHFPHDLAQKINNHPSLQHGVDSGKEIPLSHYLKQTHVMAEYVRVREGQLRHFQDALASMFQALDRSDVVAFVAALSGCNNYVWGYASGRCRREQTPPSVPTEVVSPETIKCVPRIHVSRGDKGDFVIDLADTVHRVVLEWSDLKYPDEKARCEKMASGWAKDIAEFNIAGLKAVLGAIQNDLTRDLASLSSIHAEIRQEERDFSFVAVEVMVRNKGRRTFCVDPQARLFIDTDKYSFIDPTSNKTVSINGGTEVDLVGGDGQQIIEVQGGQTAVVRFSSTTTVGNLPNHTALRHLARAGERECYIGLIAYREQTARSIIYCDGKTFSIRESTLDLPPKANRTKTR